MNRIERRARALINPYSTGFSRWWCRSGRHMRLSRMIIGERRRDGRAVRHGEPDGAYHACASEDHLSGFSTSLPARIWPTGLGSVPR